MKNTEEYERLKKKADEYMQEFATGALSYNNSHHRSVARQNYRHVLIEAEKLKDKEKINAVKESIHFLDAG